MFIFTKVYLLVNYHFNLDVIYCKIKNFRLLFFFNFLFVRSKEEKCTKGQPCSTGICTWNQHIIFFDIDTIDNMSLWIKLINLEHNQDILGEIKFNKLNLNAQSEWYSLHDISHGLVESSFSRTLPSTTDMSVIINSITICLSRFYSSSTTINRKRQLPNIPSAQLDANREKGLSFYLKIFSI
jgi:hypothetical protein